LILRSCKNNYLNFIKVLKVNLFFRSYFLLYSVSFVPSKKIALSLAMTTQKDAVSIRAKKRIHQ
ncbi:MAG: hypothetical protein PSX42_11655, partial [bacterium]|nr:hypothetical protein [bacterium]